LDLLNRPIDSGASSLFQTQLTGGATRSDIANEIQNTDEFRTDIVTTYYQQFLHHAPDSFGLNFNTSLLANSGTEQQVIANLIAPLHTSTSITAPANTHAPHTLYIHASAAGQAAKLNAGHARY